MPVEADFKSPVVYLTFVAPGFGGIVCQWFRPCLPVQQNIITTFFEIVGGNGYLTQQFDVETDVELFHTFPAGVLYGVCNHLRSAQRVVHVYACGESYVVKVYLVDVKKVLRSGTHTGFIATYQTVWTSDFQVTDGVC